MFVPQSRFQGCYCWAMNLCFLISHPSLLITGARLALHRLCGVFPLKAHLSRFLWLHLLAALLGTSTNPTCKPTSLTPLLLRRFLTDLRMMTFSPSGFWRVMQTTAMDGAEWISGDYLSPTNHYLSSLSPLVRRLDRSAFLGHKNKMATHPQVSRWKHDRPPSLQQFMADFADDAACADWLERRRWPDGFVCPCCHARKGWKLETKPWTFECARCGKQTSVTAGTILHGTHLPLRTWFIAAHLVATHSNGVSALQLQGKLGIGSYKAAWLLLHKLRKSMVDPDRDPLAGMVEVDETSIAFRTKDDPVAGGQGRSHDGKILIVGAVESIEGGKAGRIRLSLIGDYCGKTLKDFIAANTASGSTILTDGFSSYPGMNDRYHEPKVVGTMAAHVLLPWIHRVFSNLKRLSLGVYHGFRKAHIQAYLDEFVFRWNRRRHYRSAFDTLLGIGLRTSPMDYWTLIGRPSPHRAASVI